MYRRPKKLALNRLRQIEWARDRTLSRAGHVLLPLCWLCTVISACSSEAVTPSGSAGNGAQIAGGGSAAAAGRGNAGIGSAVGGGGASPAGGGAGPEVAGASGSGASPTGGFAGQGSSGAAGAAAGSTAQGGSAGAENDLAAAAVLDHYQLLDPCQASYKAVATPGDVCPQDTAVKNQAIPLQFAGDAAVTYNVTLHVRGIMEGYWYSGGVLDSANMTFYTGGVPTVGGYSSACKNKTSELPFALPAEITPSDNCWNGFNMFALTVSSPKQHYYLNYTAKKDNDRPPHAVYPSDYTVTIPIQGQAKLQFYVVGSDEHECYNVNQLTNGVNTTPSPYIGEFVQFDVTRVTRAQQ
jgi:hypothetical protein